VTYRFKIF